MKRLIICLTLLATGTLLWLSATAADRQTKDTMQEKLLYSKGLLEGIVTEDLDAVADYARRLHALSQSADWSIRQTTEYQRHTREFARQAKAIENAAVAKNIDGATLGYFQLTMTCVNCHRHMKGTEQAAINLEKIDQKRLASGAQ